MTKMIRTFSPNQHCPASSNNSNQRSIQSNPVLKKYACQKGLTFVEILVAFMVLTVALLAAVEVVAKNNQYLGRLREHVQAMQVLRRQAEIIRNQTFSQILSSPSNFSMPSNVTLVNPSGTMSVEDSYSEDMIRKVTLRLDWESLSGGAQNMELVTNVTKKGLNGK